MNIELIKKRKELLSNCQDKVEISVDINKDLYEKINKISIEKNIEIEDILVSAIIDLCLINMEKEENIDETIDEAILLINQEEIYNNNKNYLVLETKTLNKKFKIMK